MGNKHWFHDPPDLKVEQKRLEEAMKKVEERKKADEERFDNIKYCWLKYGELSDADLSWLVMKVEKKLKSEGWEKA